MPSDRAQWSMSDSPVAVGALTNSCRAMQSASRCRMTLSGRSAITRPSVPLFPCTLYVATRSILIAFELGLAVSSIREEFELTR